MDVKKIESLAKLMKETGLTGLELVEDGQQLRLERQVEVVAAPVAAPAPAAPVPATGAEALGVTHEEPAPVKEGPSFLVFLRKASARNKRATAPMRRLTKK